MFNDDQRKELQEGISKAKKVWTGLLCSMISFIIIVHVFQRSFASSTFPYEILRNLLFLVGLITFIILPVIRRVLFRTHNKVHKSEFPGDVSNLNLSNVVDKYLLNLVVLLGLAEGITIYGVILFYLRNDFLTFYIFLIASVIAIILFCKPKLADLEKLAIYIAKQKYFIVCSLEFTNF